MNKIAILLLILCSSCNFHTSVNYQKDKKEEYVRADGFVIDCEKETIKGIDYLTVGTFTPSTYKAYYTYLNGLRSEKEVEVLDVKLQFLQTGDTLELKQVSGAKTFLFYSQNLNDIIEKNKSLSVTVYLRDLKTGVNEKREFLLTRKKRTYPTGTFPHA